MVSARDSIGRLIRLIGGRFCRWGIAAILLGGALGARAADPVAVPSPAASPSPTPMRQPVKPPQSILPARMELEPLDTLPIFRDGRVGSYFLFCRDSLVLISGSETYGDTIYGKLPALTVITSLWLNSESWEDQSLILVSDLDLRRALSLPSGSSRAAFSALMRQTRLAELIADARATESEPGGAELGPLQKKVLALARRLERFRDIRDGGAMLMVPPAGAGEWARMEAAPKLYPGPLGQSVPELVERMKEAFRDADPRAFAAARDALADTLPRLNPAEYPHPSQYEFEIWITKADLGWWAGLALAFAAAVNMLTFQRRRGVGYGLACFLAILGAALLAAEIVGHSRIARVGMFTALAGSPYLIPLAIILAGLLIELCWRKRYVLMLATVAAALWLFVSGWLAR